MITTHFIFSLGIQSGKRGIYIYIYSYLSTTCDISYDDYSVTKNHEIFGYPVVTGP